MNREGASSRERIIPAAVWVFVFTIVPLLYFIYLSFYDYNVLRPARFVGLQNFSLLFDDSRMPLVIGNTVLFAVGSTVITLFVGTVAAWIFSFDAPGIRFLRTLFTMPLFAAPVAIATLAQLIFSPIFGWFTSRPILGDISTAPFAIMAVDAWQWLPLVFVVVLNAIRDIPEWEYESARLETRSETTIFTAITLPRARNALILILILRLIQSLQLFDVPFVLTRGGPANATTTLPLYLYLTGFQRFDFGYAAAIGMVLLVPLAVLAVLFIFGLRRRFATTVVAQSVRDTLQGLRAYTRTPRTPAPARKSSLEKLNAYRTPKS